MQLVLFVTYISVSVFDLGQRSTFSVVHQRNTFNVVGQTSVQ